MMERSPRVSPKSAASNRGRPAAPRPLLLLLALFPMVGCFEDRIEERLVIGVREDGVELFYEASYHERHGHGDRAATRVAGHERELLDGNSPWLRALASIPEPVRHGSEAIFDEDRGDGPLELESFGAWARSRSRDGAALAHVFGHTAVTAALTRENRALEIDLTAGAALGGTRRQRLRMERDLEAWSRSVASYLDRVADLWRMLEANPRRQRPIYEALFADLLDPSPDPDLLPAESELLDRLDEAEGAVAEMFETEEERAHSLQELSRLIYDPYPLEIVVARLDDDGRVTREAPSLTEGFEAVGDGSWRVRRTSLWDAYAALRGVWVTPDPLSIKIEALRQVVLKRGDHAPDFDLDALLNEPPRVWRRPTAFEVAEEIKGLLSPPDVVRIVWSD